MPAWRELAIKMLRAALSLRRFDFGENVTVEGAIASFFIFATFFGLGMHKAAWLRLRKLDRRFLHIGTAATYQLSSTVSSRYGEAASRKLE